MSRQMDLKAEVRETKKRDALVRGLEISLNASLQFQGAELRGFSIRYGDFDCLLTVKANFEGRWHVANVSSDTMMNVMLKLFADAEKGRLTWRPDKFQPTDS